MNISYKVIISKSTSCIIEARPSQLKEAKLIRDIVIRLSYRNFAIKIWVNYKKPPYCLAALFHETPLKKKWFQCPPQTSYKFSNKRHRESLFIELDGKTSCEHHQFHERRLILALIAKFVSCWGNIATNFSLGGLCEKRRNIRGVSCNLPLKFQETHWPSGSSYGVIGMFEYALSVKKKIIVSKCILYGQCFSSF